MSKKIVIEGNYAMLDVKKGRKKLAKLFDKQKAAGFGMRIPVVIYGFLTEPVSYDDGVSIEFGVNVTDIQFDTN